MSDQTEFSGAEDNSWKPAAKDADDSPLEAPNNHPAFALAAPISGHAGPTQVIEGLLKSPGSIIARILKGRSNGIAVHAFVIALIAHIAYGLIVGSFSGGTQWYWAPIKITNGALLCGLICFPSLFIFGCLSGADLRITQFLTLMVSSFALAGTLLIGFAPIAWIFSQSTSGIFFMGICHLLFWGISIRFALALLWQGLRSGKAENPRYFVLWSFIFMLTTLQMMTTLRPLIGTSEEPLDRTKKFFVQHWVECLIKPLNSGR